MDLYDSVSASFGVRVPQFFKAIKAKIETVTTDKDTVNAWLTEMSSSLLEAQTIVKSTFDTD